MALGGFFSKVAERFARRPTVLSPAPDRSAAEDLLLRADQRRDSQDWRAAADGYREVLRLRPDLCGIWVQLGHCLKELSEFEAAAAAYRQAASLGQELVSRDALLHLGHLLWRGGRRGDAKIAFFGVVTGDIVAESELRELRLSAHAALGGMFSEDRNWTAAIYHYEAALDTAPDRYLLWVQLGHALKEVGASERAEYCYLAAIDIDPTHVDAWRQVGHLYRRLARPRDAMRAFARALILDVTSTDTLDALRHTAGYSYFEVSPFLAEAATHADDEAARCVAQLRLAEAAFLARSGMSTSLVGVDLARRHEATRYMALNHHRVIGGEATGMDIVLLSNIAWHYRRQRAQHLASALAALGARVFFVSPFIGESTAPRAAFLVDEPAPGVFLAELYGVTRRKSVHDAMDPDDARQVRAGLNELLRDLAVEDPVFLVQHPGWAVVLEPIPAGPLVYDCLDDVAAFPEQSEAIVRLERHIVETADMVLCTSRLLFDRVPHERRMMVRNAVECGRVEIEPSRDPTDDGRPVLGYVGALAEWFDYDLVRQVAAALPNWIVLIVGDARGNEQRFGDLPNIVLAGEVDYEKLPAVMARFTVAMIPFVESALTAATDPVKVYEYLGMGLPVVATGLPDLIENGAPVRHVRGAEAFVQAVSASIADNDAEQRRLRRAWAATNHWGLRAQAVAAVIRDFYPAIAVPQCDAATPTDTMSFRRLYRGQVRSGSAEEASVTEVAVPGGATAGSQWLQAARRQIRLAVDDRHRACEAMSSTSDGQTCGLDKNDDVRTTGRDDDVGA